MKHFYELKTEEILKFLNAPVYHIQEKLDGSFISAGIDEQGRFYTQRKGTKRYYDVRDWPDLAWANAFRSAHVALESFFDFLRSAEVNFRETDKLNANRIPLCQPGLRLDCEVIYGNMPNTIVYGTDINNSIVVFGVTIPKINQYIRHDFLGRRFESKYIFTQLRRSIERRGFTIGPSITVNTFSYETDDGINIKKVFREITWNFKTPCVFEISRSDAQLDEIRTWLNKTVSFSFGSASIYELLSTKLTVYPKWVDPEVWKSNRKGVVAEIKTARANAQAQLYERYIRVSKHLNTWIRAKLEHISDSYTSAVTIYNGIEGAILQPYSSHEQLPIVKFVDKTWFEPINNFTHIVRYWLMGGRRPARPSFLTRTAHWPKEKRLKRLEQLRQRFIANLHKLNYNAEYSIFYNHSELYYRTLVIFAELKQRIENGRCSVQDIDQEGLEVGNSTDSQVASV